MGLPTSTDAESVIDDKTLYIYAIRAKEMSTRRQVNRSQTMNFCIHLFVLQFIYICPGELLQLNFKTVIFNQLGIHAYFL